MAEDSDSLISKNLYAGAVYIIVIKTYYILSLDPEREEQHAVCRH